MLPQPGRGRKRYTDEQGKVVRVYQWFGYELHSLVDVKHEVVPAWQITSAEGEATGDGSVLAGLLEAARQLLPGGGCRRWRTTGRPTRWTHRRC